jgi:hypothetical protein
MRTTAPLSRIELLAEVVQGTFEWLPLRAPLAGETPLPPS